MADEQKADAKPKPAAAPPAAPKAPAIMAATPWEDDLTRRLAEQFPDQITEFSTYLGQNFLVAKPEAVVPILEFLKLEADFDYLVDVTAVDWPEAPRALRPGLHPLQLRAQRAHAHQDPHRRRRQAGNRGGRAPDRQLAGARGLRHVRHRVRRPSRPAAHPDAGRVAGLPAAQGLRHPPAWTTAGCRRTWASKAGSNAYGGRHFSTPPNWSSTWGRSTRPRTACCA